MRNAALEIGDDAAEMVRDDFQVRESIHDAGKDETRERSAGLKGPANDAADFVFGDGLGAVVRHLARADRMQQDWLAGFLDDLIDREELLLVDGRAVHVGVQLDRIRPVRKHAFGFAWRCLRCVHGQRRGIADEAIGIFRDHLRKAVVADPRPFR